MGKRVLYIVVDPKGDKIDEQTKSSVSQNLGKEDAQVFIKIADDSKELYYSLKVQANKIINDVNNFDYVCVLPNGATLTSEAKAIFEEYQVDREDEVKESYLPLALYKTGETSVLLNKHIWNSMVAYEAGVLDTDLALKQVDSTVFGAYIPTQLFFNQEYYSESIKYYQQYHLLTNLTDGDNLVLGIPKILVSFDKAAYDFVLEDVSNEEKIENFNLAREKWTKKEEKTEAKPETQKAQA